FIFGGTGDLTSRKLIPALYNLYLDGWMPPRFAIIGLGRTSLNNDQYRDQLAKGVNQFSRRGKADAGQWKAFAEHIEYQVSEISSLDAYALQAENIQRYRSEWKVDPIVIIYFSVDTLLFTTLELNM